MYMQKAHYRPVAGDHFDAILYINMDLTDLNQRMWSLTWPCCDVIHACLVKSVLTIGSIKLEVLSLSFRTINKSSCK